MYGVIGEDNSDVEMVSEIVKRLSGVDNITIKKKGFGGAGELFKKGMPTLRLFNNLKCSRFIVVYDSDGESAERRRNRIFDEIVRPAKIAGEFCALVPTQEIEAWILADLSCVTKHFRGWAPKQTFASPENVVSPKEQLRRLSRDGVVEPRYINTMHNPILAKHLDLAVVRKKCPSFEPLYELVVDGRGNTP